MVLDLRRQMNRWAGGLVAVGTVAGMLVGQVKGLLWPQG